MNKLCVCVCVRILLISMWLICRLRTSNTHLHSLVNLTLCFIHYRWQFYFKAILFILTLKITFLSPIIQICKEIMAAFKISVYIFWFRHYFNLSDSSIQSKWKLHIISVSEGLNLEICRVCTKRTYIIHSSSFLHSKLTRTLINSAWFLPISSHATQWYLSMKLIYEGPYVIISFESTVCYIVK